MPNNEKYKDFDIYSEMKEMEYKSNSELHNGYDILWMAQDPKGYRIVIVSYGTHPCAYIGLWEGHPYYEVDYEDIPIDCHGGLNYSDHCHWNVKDLQFDDVWFIGWDYIHSGDYDYNNKFGRRWTTEEIADECLNVIKQLEEAKKEDADMGCYNVSKWDAAPESIKILHDVFNVNNSDKYQPFLEEILDDYNELEAKYQKQCGLISDYETALNSDPVTKEKEVILSAFEEAKKRDLIPKHDVIKVCIDVNHVDSLDEDNETPGHVVIMFGDQKTEMEQESAQHQLEELQMHCDELNRKYETQKVTNRKLAAKNRELGLEIAERCEQIHELKNKLYDCEKRIDFGKDTILKAIETALHIYVVSPAAKESSYCTRTNRIINCIKSLEQCKNNWGAKWQDLRDILSKNEDDYDMLDALLEKDGYSIEYDGDIDDETIRCQTEYDIHRETTPDEVTLQYGRWTLRRPQNFSEARANADVAILKKQIRDRDKEIAELKERLANRDYAQCKTCERKVCGERAVEIIENLRIENNNLITDNKGLGKAIDAWCKMYNEMRHKRDALKKENEELQKKLDAVDERLKTYLNHEYGLCKICGWKASSKRKDKIIEELTKDRKRLDEVNKALRRTVNILDDGGYF